MSRFTVKYQCKISPRPRLSSRKLSSLLSSQLIWMWTFLPTVHLGRPRTISGRRPLSIWFQFHHHHQLSLSLHRIRLARPIFHTIPRRSRMLRPGALTPSIRHRPRLDNSMHSSR
ncbi:hypothetical protein B0H17DRAFT_984760 [Mycena rosella]|uniref:Uncharacterized protein n=1 Tax=Mycena rosella TaxID=1033263 RepID=A0AAD7DB69_MYCRO|nr:hypothetical protein B0H17DRAFT_984760 [Mycena rosella]